MTATLTEWYAAEKDRREQQLRWEGAVDAMRLMAAMLDAVGGELTIPYDSLVAIDNGDPYISKTEGELGVTYRLNLKAPKP